MIRRMFLVLLLLAGCSGDDPAEPPANDEPGCPDGPMLTVSPIAFEDLDSVYPLGNINPPGHISPTDHMGLTIRVEPGADAPVETDLLSPGDLVVTQLSAQEFVNAGYADFGIGLQPCEDIYVGFGHVTSLDPDLFDFAGDFADWTLLSEDVQPDETYRYYRFDCEVPVVAGQRLGSGGGVADQWGVDISVYDLTLPPATMASDRWDGEWYLNSRCILDYFVDGAVHDALYQLLELPQDVLDAGDACGNLYDDVPGALRGVWFHESTTLTWPDENNLSFSVRNTDPGQYLIGMGVAAATVPGAAYFIETTTTGNVNRVFEEVTPASGLQYYDPLYQGGLLILVQMVAPDTLWIEGVAGAEPGDGVQFSGAKSVFVR